MASAGKLAAIVLLLALSSDGRNSAAVATTAARAPALRVAVTPARWWPALKTTDDGAGGVHSYYSRSQETTLPSALDNSSRVLWNEFWLQQCNASSFPLSQFGIAANARNAQNGDVVTILGGGSLEGQHRQGPFMDWPKISKDGSMQNGGLPQRANLSAAMRRIDAAIAALPPGFHGSLYFDMESWDPLWGMTPPQYRNASLAWVLQRHPELSRGAAMARAQTEYEAAAKSWMMAPLQSVRRQRPRALVGYYNYPKCADRMQCEQYPAGSNASAMNDQLSWLYALSSALYPTIYYDFVWHGGPAPIVRESRRLAGPSKRVLPVWWYYGCGSYSKFCSGANQLAQWRAAVSAGSDGFVVWGGGQALATGLRQV